MNNSTTDFVPIEQCHGPLRDALRVLSPLAACIGRGDVVFGLDAALSSGLYVTAARQTVGRLDGETKLVASMLVDECRKLDSSVGYASLAFIDAVCHASTMSALDDIHGHAAMLQAHVTKLSSMDIVYDAVTKCAATIRGERVGRMVNRALRLAGLTGKIELLKSNHGDNIVELTQGYRFPIGTTEPVWSRTDVRCLIIDGFIESIDEIDRLLTGAHRKSAPLLLICRGCSKDVRATLVHNRARGTLDAQIVVVPLDVHGSNMLKDIAACTCGDVVTSLRGHDMSSYDFDDLHTVASVTISDVLSIRHPSREAVDQHLAQLIQSKTQNTDAANEIIDKRIATLLDARVQVTFTGEPREAQADLERGDILLRSVRSIMAHGLIDASAAKGTSPTVDAVIDRLQSIYSCCPAAMCFATTQAVERFMDLLTKSAGIIKLDA